MRKEIVIAKCKNCGKDFRQLHKRHYFCCTNCKKEYDKLHRDNTYVCDNCGKEYHTYQYKRGKNNFCCYQCSIEYRIKIAKEERECEWCHTKFVCNHSEKLRFCSIKCQSMWQKYVFQDEEHREISRTRTIQMLQSGTMMNFRSKTHQKVEQLLKENNIEFQSEQRFNNFVIDIIINNKCVEIMGDYWHLNPCKYSDIDNEQQVRGVERDTNKYQYFIQNKIPLLCIWEYDIINNTDKIINIINEYINSDNIDIIHSFNVINHTNIIPLAQQKAYNNLGSPEVDNKGEV